MSGYFRFPTIHKNQIVFVSENDLWSVDLNNLKAIRLTTNLSSVTTPLFSPDGKWIAYVGIEDGNTEVYLISSNGGQSKRLTYDGGFINKIAAWKNDNIIYTSDLKQPFQRISDLRQVNVKGGNSKSLRFGIASNISFSKKSTIIGRNTQDPARWKRYKGGTAGEIWIDKTNTGNYAKLINLKGNMACPMFINEKIYFISDHDGLGNIYSCSKSGKQLEQHTFHKEYYARNATTDGHSIIYHAGADIYIYDINNKVNKKIKIKYSSSLIDKSRKFPQTSRYLESISISKKGNILSAISRGKLYTMGIWNGPVFQYGKMNGVRYKHNIFLKDDKKILTFSDQGNIEKFEIYNLENGKLVKRLKTDLGRALNVKKSPVSDMVAIINHKHELWIFDTSKDKGIKIDKSSHAMMQCNWSPDGKYIAYSCSKTSRTSIIKIYDISKKKSYDITKPISNDFSPVFDSNGKYLAFHSNRTFNPVYDSIQFDLNFTVSEKAYLVTLNEKVQSPFIKDPNYEDLKAKDKTKKDKKVKVEIDFKNIQNRIMEIPIKETILDNDIGFIDNKIFYLEWPVEGSRQDGWYDIDSKPKGILKYYDLNELEEKVFMANVSSFSINYKNSNILVKSGQSVRLLSTKAVPSKEVLNDPKFNKTTGLVDFNRIKLEVNVGDEWRQMYSEAWRLQRDHFWVSNMSNINWDRVYRRYLKLVDRVNTRSEFSDLIWEMQGELGTSHCYEFGGDYIYPRNYTIGMLGADFEYDKRKKAYRINTIAKGDLWMKNSSPLLRPGLGIKEGDYIKEINNIALSENIMPGKILVNNAESEVQLTVISKNKNKKVTIKTLRNESHLHYRDWVEYNREYVHKKSNNKIGYVHIPDMGADGFAEFHRYFLAEIIYDGLIIDVRYNGGGHVSQLLLSKLAKKRIGFDLTRWMGVEPYPSESPAGPMVAITNEYAGSDGDIFSHSWKLMNLGKIIGRRTWGGVIGIWPRNALVDGTLTTQPEFSFWFKDVGWSVENYGTDVDEEIHITPKDYRANNDTQLNRAIEIVKHDMKKDGAILSTDFSDKPDLKLPR